MLAILYTMFSRTIPRMKSFFSYSDPFDIYSRLKPDERMIQSVAREYCQKELMPRILMANRNEVFDRNIMKEMGKIGLLGITLPETYGCANAGYVSY